jgi:predicted transcriptional regulator
VLTRAYCEEFVKYSTSIRLAVALDLVNRYKYTQLQAARAVNIPQPLLSYVIHGKRKPRYLDLIMNNSELKGTIEKLADQIASGKPLLLCDFCRVFKHVIEKHAKRSL